MRKLLLAAVLLALAAGPAAAQVKMGILMGLSGPLASLGPAIEAGALQAADEANQAGGINGNTIEVITRDTATNPSVGRDAAARLVETDQVPAIVGALSSGVTTAATSVTIPGQTVLISPASTAPSLSDLEDNGYFFRTAPSDALQGRVLSQVAQDRGYKSAATIYVNNPYGKGLADSFRADYENAGNSVEAMVAYEENKPSYRGEAQQVINAGAEVINVIAYPQDGNKILVSLIEQGYEGDFLFSDGMRAEDVASGPAQQYIEGSYGTSPGSIETAVSSAFDSGYDAYVQRTGKQVDKSAPFRKEAYDAMALVILAAAASGPDYANMSAREQGRAIRDNLLKVANPPGTEVTYGEFSRAFELLKNGQDINYQGVAGPMTFYENGDVKEAAYDVYRFAGGQVQTVDSIQLQ